MAKKENSASWNIRTILLAVIAGLLLVTLIFKNFKGSVDGVALYQEYFQKYPLNLSKDAANPNNRIYTAETAYNEGKYDIALPILESFIRTQGNVRGKLGLGAACCLLETGKDAEAIAHLDQVMENGLGGEKTQAKWYKALALLRQNKVEPAKELVRQLSVDIYAVHHEQAKELIKKL
ncbi:MAG: hypothetical protein AAFV95_23855 [Bacteroidota bacterium]